MCHLAIVLPESIASSRMELGEIAIRRIATTSILAGKVFQVHAYISSLNTQNNPKKKNSIY